MCPELKNLPSRPKGKVRVFTPFVRRRKGVMVPDASLVSHGGVKLDFHAPRGMFGKDLSWEKHCEYNKEANAC
jgi:hypothetical protein